MQRRRAGGAQAQDCVARRHHAHRDVAARVHAAPDGARAAAAAALSDDRCKALHFADQMPGLGRPQPYTRTFAVTALRQTGDVRRTSLPWSNGMPRGPIGGTANRGWSDGLSSNALSVEPLTRRRCSRWTRNSVQPLHFLGHRVRHQRVTAHVDHAFNAPTTRRACGRNRWSCVHPADNDCPARDESAVSSHRISI